MVVVMLLLHVSRSSGVKPIYNNYICDNMSLAYEDVVDLIFYSPIWGILVQTGEFLKNMFMTFS